jgi:hypothetical protein
MGTWGSGILDDDTARDVYDRYLEAHRTGKNGDAIVRALCKEFARVVSDPDEGPVFWLAVAQAQWDSSAVTTDVRERVEEILAKGLGLSRWADEGAAQLKARQAAVSRFARKIRTPRKRITRPAPEPAAVPFEVGDCLAIELADGRFGAGVITKHLAGTSPSDIVSIVAYHEDEPPAAGRFNPPSWIPVTETPELTILKYQLYADGYRRHRNRYRVVCRIELGVVPPPLTLRLGNWGNFWTDLGERLDASR